jgi:superfamily II DNA or RNA helicase
MAQVHQRHRLTEPVMAAINNGMPEIVVHRHNTVYTRLSCEPAIAREIQEYFTFEVPNARFTPAYRNRHWDGKIRMFQPRNSLLYVGLLDYLAKFCEEHKYHLTVDRKLINPVEPCTREHCVSKIIDGLNLTARGQRIEPHEHQIDAIHHALNTNRCLLLSPTASGKSLIIYVLARAYSTLLNMIDADAGTEPRRTLIIVPSISLVTQLYNDFKDYSAKDPLGWNVDDFVHKVYGGEEKDDPTKQIVITTWQSIYKLPKDYFDQFGAVFGDEAHLFKAASLTSIMTKLTNCPYRIALTGTLDGTQTHKLAIEGLFGTVKQVTTTKDLMEKKLLSNLEIDCILLTYPEEICKTVAGIPYQEEIDWIVGCDGRNALISKLACSTKGNTLVLFQFVEKHGKPLYERIKENAGNSRKVFYVSGETEGEVREEIRQITEQEDNAIIVASYGTFSTGINIRSLRNIIFASPSKSRIRVLQSIGRQLRKSERKDKARLYDIADDLHWKSKKNHTLKHFIERVKIYNEESFDYKMVKIPIKEVL